MKRVVPILVFFLILIFRQAPSAITVGQGQKGYSNLQEANPLLIDRPPPALEA